MVCSETRQATVEEIGAPVDLEVERGVHGPVQVLRPAISPSCACRHFFALPDVSLSRRLMPLAIGGVRRGGGIVDEGAIVAAGPVAVDVAGDDRRVVRARLDAGHRPRAPTPA